MVKKKTTKKKVTKKKAVKKKTVKKKVVKKKTGRQKLQEQMEAKNKEQEDASVAEDEVTEDEVTEDEVNDNTDKKDDIDKVDSDTSDEENKPEEDVTDTKKKKKLKPVTYAEMIQAFSIFLTTDVMLLKYKLSIRSAGPRRHVVFQGMVSKKWADLRSGGSSLFRRTSLLRRIKTLDKDSELYRYFENYALTTGKESYVNND